MKFSERSLDCLADFIAGMLACTPLALACAGLLLLGVVSNQLAVLAGFVFGLALIAAHLWL